MSRKAPTDTKTVVSTMILENKSLSAAQKQALLRNLKAGKSLPAQMPRDYQPVVSRPSRGAGGIPQGRFSYGPRRTESVIRQEQARAARLEGTSASSVPSRPNLAAEKERYLLRLEAEASGNAEGTSIIEAVEPGGPLRVRGTQRMGRRGGSAGAASSSKENELDSLANSIRAEIKERRAFLAEMERLGQAEGIRHGITVEIQEREKELATLAGLAESPSSS